MTETAFRPPAWRRAAAHSVGDTRFFHACDPDDDKILCDFFLSLAASVEPPNEGSEFCPECMAIVRGQ